MSVAPQTGLAASVEATLRHEAEQNELTLAWVRLGVLSLAATFQLASHVHAFESLGYPLRTPLWLGLGTFACVLPAAGLMVALRRGGFRSWMVLAIPAWDALVLVGEHVAVWRVLGHTPSGVQNVSTSFGITAALLILSGALRLQRRAVVASTVAGVGSYVGALLFLTPTLAWSILYVAALQLAVAFLGVRLMGLVRRAMRAEVSKVLLGRFLPQELVERAHGAGAGLIPPPRQLDATILVTDLRGFTSLAESRPPEEVLRLLNELQGAFAREVRAEQGVVDKFMGDGMLAVFGAPTPADDHALRAVRATRGLQRALREVNASRVARGEGALGIGIGVHSGLVVAGCLGGEERLEFTVIGDTVNVAARLEGLTKEQHVEVLISEETVRRLPAGEVLQPVGEVKVRGREAPLAVYTIG